VNAPVSRFSSIVRWAKQVTAFHHLDAAASHEFVGRQRLDLRPVEHDRAFGDLAAFGIQQV
jgi:hypothetical protein